MPRTLLLATVLALAASGTALAQQAPLAPDGTMPPPPGMGDGMRGGGMGGLMRADTNGDGMISREEAKAQADARFAAMDTNHDGVLTADELTGPGARGLARADADGDGKITHAEYDAAMAKRFARLDANGDGVISADEIRAAMERGRAMRDRRADPADAVAPPPPAPSPTPNPGQ